MEAPFIRTVGNVKLTAALSAPGEAGVQLMSLTATGDSSVV
jgi:hypothetical protein